MSVATAILRRMNMTPSVEESWARFEAWLADHAPVTHATLRAPADSAHIAAAEERIGIAFPNDLVTLLSLHDGTCACVPGSGSFWEGGGGPCLLPGGHALLSVDGIVHTHQMLTGIHGTNADGDADGDADADAGFVSWHPLWIPFAERITGDNLFVDRRPARGAIGEFWHDDANIPDLWPSLAAMIADIADAAEQARNIRYYRPRVEAGVLHWEIV